MSVNAPNNDEDVARLCGLAQRGCLPHTSLPNCLKSLYYYKYSKLSI